MSIDFTPHAVYDIDTASEYLEADKDGGGGRFRTDLVQLLAHLELMPEAAERYEPPNPRHPGLRFRQLPVFWHYAVYYRPVPDGILVVRVLHTSRNIAAIFAPDPDPPA